MKDISEIALTDDGELLLKIKLSQETLDLITEHYEGKEHQTFLYVLSADGLISLFISPVVQ